jgi:threonine dehydrogenase-like Zn-dependent dehydrogenase
MSKTMLALRAHAPFDYRIDEIEIGKVEAGEVLLKVKGCGVCASDTKTYHGGERIWGTSPETQYIQAPITAGHEVFGEVVEIGVGVTHVAVGDIVAAEQIVPCGKCEFCIQGNYWMCQPHEILGFRQIAPGGFAEYCKLDKNARVYKLPKDFPVEMGSIIEPYGCAMHAVDRAELTHTDVLVVSGLGTIGLAMVAIAKKYSPNLIIGLDIQQKRMDKALEFGADYVFNPADCDVVAEIKKLTDGYGCDKYIEASGHPASSAQGLGAIRNLGTYVQFGIYASVIPFDLNIVGDTKEINVHGSHLSPYCFKAVIDGMIDGSIRTDGIVTHVFKLKDWEEAFEVAEKDPEAIKVALIP